MFLGRNPNIATLRGDNFLDVTPKGRSIWDFTEESELFDLTKPFELTSEEGKQVFPRPGFCVKSKTNEGVKVFINMCHCQDVPKPDDELMWAKDRGTDEFIRFPVGLGLPHKEKDKSGKDCICFDVVINTEFLNTLRRDEDARNFVLSLCIQGIADKYDIFVRDDCCTKLSKPYHGNMQKYFVKNTDSFGLRNPLQKDSSGPSAPLIRVMESSPIEDKAVSFNPFVESVRPKDSKSKNKYPVQSKEDKSPATSENPVSVIPEPSSSMLPEIQKPGLTFGLFQVPADTDYPVQYVLEADMPNCSDDDRAHLNVLVSNDRIVVTEKMHNYNIDVTLPNPVIPEQCRANFSGGTLVVVLPLADISHSEDN